MENTPPQTYRLTDVVDISDLPPDSKTYLCYGAEDFTDAEWQTLHQWADAALLEIKRKIEADETLPTIAEVAAMVLAKFDEVKPATSLNQLLYNHHAALLMKQSFDFNINRWIYAQRLNQAQRAQQSPGGATPAMMMYSGPVGQA